MDYIFDASTLILLAKITLLRKFSEINNIIIGHEVKLEVLNKKDFDDTKVIEKLIEEKLIEETNRKVSFEGFANDFGLDNGEAESLFISFEDKTNLATDDWKVIKACKILGVKFITAIHCLIQIYKLGEIDKDICLEKLKNLEKFGRYDSSIIKNAQQIIKGNKNE